jgi:DNA polymerase III epsilon subunit-like protein
LYVDIETTGLEPSEGAVMLSIGAIAELDEGEEVATLPNTELIILPTKDQWGQASPKALQVNGMTWEYLEKHGVPLRDAEAAFGRFIAEHVFLKGFVHVGQNPDFDLKFLRFYWALTLVFLGYPFSKPTPINIIELTKETQRFDPTLKTRYYNSHAISKALGVEEESKVHTAMGGTLAVYRNYKALYKRFTDWVDKLHKAADKESTPDLMRLPVVCPNFKDWERAAKELGWLQPSTYHFVDKDGVRYTCVWGKPPFLLKI